MTLGNMRQNGVRTLAPLLFAASLLAESVQAQSLSQQDLDLSCAIASGAEMGANPKGSAEQSVATMISLSIWGVSLRETTKLTGIM